MSDASWSAQIEFLADEKIYEHLVERSILEAKRLVRIASANLKDVHLRSRGGSLLKRLAEFVREGGEVHILHSGIPSGRFLETLRTSGLASQPGFSMKRCVRMHIKAVLIDGHVVFLGSPNFTGAGLGAKSKRRRNFEIGLLSRDQRLFDLVERRFDEVWSGKACENCGRTDVCYEPLEEPQV